MSHAIPGTSGQQLSPTQIYQLAVQAGWSATDAVMATAIAMAESGGRTNIANDQTNAAGIWQILTGSQSLTFQQAMSDPVANATAAVNKFRSQGWCAWAAYDEGSCAGEKGRDNSWRTYLQQAQAASTGVDIAGGGGSLVSGGGAGGNVAPATSAAGGGTLTLLNIPNPFGDPFKVQIPLGILWAVLFFGGAIALVLIGILLYARSELPSIAL
jgi:hypothetical protein